MFLYCATHSTLPDIVRGVQVHPGDLIAADDDGMVVIPNAIANSIIDAAWAKALAENNVRDAVSAGLSATEAF